MPRDSNAPEANSRRGRRDEWSYLRRVAIVAGVAVFLFVVWKVLPVLMLLFGSLLLATLIRGAAKQIERIPFISQRWAFAIVVATAALSLSALVMIVGSQIARQLRDVFRRIPEALNAAGDQLGITDTSRSLESLFESAYGSQTFSSIAGFGYTVFGGLTDLIIILVAAVYLAADPGTYRTGFTKLFHPKHHQLVFETLTAIGIALRQWFAGQLVSMVAVGFTSGIVYWWLGLASPIGLGVIAGLTNFVPLIGPLVGAVPALLLAFMESPYTVLWVAGAILVIQQIEGNLIMPLVQQKAVDLPPALTLLAILLFGSLFGWLGVIFAAPLAVLVSVLTKKLWIRETLELPTTVAGDGG